MDPAQLPGRKLYPQSQHHRRLEQRIPTIPRSGMTPKQPSQEATSARQLAAALGGEPHCSSVCRAASTCSAHIPITTTSRFSPAASPPVHPRRGQAHTHTRGSSHITSKPSIPPPVSNSHTRIPSSQPRRALGKLPQGRCPGALDQYRLSPSATGWGGRLSIQHSSRRRLSSSSALVIAAAMLTEAVNGLPCDPATLAAYLPSAERFVGTQGGARTIPPSSAHRLITSCISPSHHPASSISPSRQRPPWPSATADKPPKRQAPPAATTISASPIATSPPFSFALTWNPIAPPGTSARPGQGRRPHPTPAHRPAKAAERARSAYPHR